MGSKDYYEILQIHPSAEPFMVTSAYRRLTREYHPDVDHSPQAHQRMVLFNEAYAVLSDPEQRRKYDQNRTKGSRPDAQGDSKKASSQPHGSEEQSRSTFGAPTPPNLTDFGIADDYLARAGEGAAAWKVRKSVVDSRLQFTLRLCSWLGGTALTFCRGVLELHIPEQALAWSWLAIPILNECVLQGIEAAADARRLKNDYNSEFNPNPTGYAKYADALAHHETQIAIVYVSRTWKYHTNPRCYGMTNCTEMPRWDAEQRGVQACSRCGYYVRRAIALPPPFGPQSATASQGVAPDQPNSRGQKKWWRVAVYATAATCALFSLSGVERPSVQVVQATPAPITSASPVPVSNGARMIVLPGIPKGDGQSYPSCMSPDGRSIVGYGRTVDAGSGAQTFVWSEDQGMRAIPSPTPDVTFAIPDFVSADGKIVAGGYSIGNSFEVGTVFTFGTGYQKVPEDLLVIKYISTDLKTEIGEGLVNDRRMPVIYESGKTKPLVSASKDRMGSLVQVSDDGRVSLVRIDTVRETKAPGVTRTQLFEITGEEYQIILYGQTIANLNSLTSCTEITSACLSRNGHYAYCVGRSGEQGQQLCAIDLTTLAAQKTLVDPGWKAIVLSGGTDDGLTAFGSVGTDQSNSDAVVWKISESPAYFRDLAVNVGLEKSLEGWRIVGVMASSADGKRLACQGESHDKYSALFIELGS